jgi:hypothetical protein
MTALVVAFGEKTLGNHRKMKKMLDSIRGNDYNGSNLESFFFFPVDMRNAKMETFLDSHPRTESRCLVRIGRELFLDSLRSCNAELSRHCRELPLQAARSVRNERPAKQASRVVPRGISLVPF